MSCQYIQSLCADYRGTSQAPCLTQAPQNTKQIFQVPPPSRLYITAERLKCLKIKTYVIENYQCAETELFSFSYLQSILFLI